MSDSQLPPAFVASSNSRRTSKTIRKVCRDIADKCASRWPKRPKVVVDHGNSKREAPPHPILDTATAPLKDVPPGSHNVEFARKIPAISEPLGPSIPSRHSMEPIIPTTTNNNATNRSDQICQPYETPSNIDPLPCGVVGRIDITRLRNTKEDIPNLSSLASRHRLVCASRYSKVYCGTYGTQMVAIKDLRIISNNRVTERKFRRELSIWWHLRHPNIVPLYGYFQHYDRLETSYSLISEWAILGSASEYIRKDLTLNQRMNLIRDVARAIKYLHEFDPIIVHGDIKPRNVLIGADGVGQLCDFGLTRLMSDGLETDLTTTTPHTGTVPYLAYELVRPTGNAVPTTATDVYAFGCLAYEFIYGLPPHSTLDSHWGISRAIGDGIPPALRPQDLPPTYGIIWDLFESCWEFNPNARATADNICRYLDDNMHRFSRSFDIPHTKQGLSSTVEGTRRENHGGRLEVSASPGSLPLLGKVEVPYLSRSSQQITRTRSSTF